MSALIWSVVVALTLGAPAAPASAPLREPHWHRPDPSSSSAASSAALSPSTTKAGPQRIVSLAPVITEALYALGAGDRVVGVTRFCDRPAAAAQKPSVGGYTDASLEQILALNPDAVVAMPSFGQRQLLDRLRDQHVPVFVVFTDSLAEERAMLGALGQLIGNAAGADRLLAQQAAVLAAVEQRQQGRGRRAVVVVGHDPLVVAGRGSFADVALLATGAASALREGDPQWPQWSLESLLARQVDIVIAAEGPDGAAALRRQLAPLGARAPRVLAADGAILMRPGPSFADDVLALERLLTATPPAP